MRSLTLCVILLAACGPSIPNWTGSVAPVDAPVPANPFVHQDGRRLVDGSGAPVTLRGVNLGGWLAWEGWIFGGGWSLDGESKLLARLAELVGRDEAERFREDVRERFVTDADLARIAALGFDTVRVPLNHVLLEEDAKPYAYRPEGWAVLDRLVDGCEAHGLRAVLDLHAAPGGQSPWFMADPDSQLLWDSNANRDRTVALWRAIAQRYANRPGIAGYDLLNEPSPPDDAALLALYRRIASAIREVDPHHLLILEGTSGASNLAPFTGPVSANQAYSVHQYEFFGDWKSDELARWTAVGAAHDVPLWIGEFGLETAGPTAKSVGLYGAPDSGIAGFAFWSWKEAVPSHDNLARITKAPKAWAELAAWLNGGAVGRPSAEAARAAMRGFLDALPIEACDVDEGMSAALIQAP
jgi:hypothetical protein